MPRKARPKSSAGSDDWFKPIQLVSRRQQRRMIAKVAARQRQKYGGEYSLVHETPGLTPPPPNYWLTGLGTATVIDGRRTRLLRIKDIAKLYKTGTTRVRLWFRLGLLGKPYIVRSAGGGQQPLWLAGQVRAIVRVLNDVYAQGYKYLPPVRLLDRHIAMAHEGTRLALERFERRAQKKAKTPVVWDE